MLQLFHRNLQEEQKLSSHPKNIKEIIAEYSSNEISGLTSSNLAELKAKYGPNKLKEKKKKGMLSRFFDQFKDVMILILIAAAIVSFVIVCVEGNWGELFEPALILLIVIINAIMGVVQESKAEKALDALQRIKGLFSFAFLNNSHNSVNNYNQKNKGGFK